MIKNAEKETLEEWAKECKEKYDKLFVQLLCKPMLGEIGTNNQMIEEMKSLNMCYFDEMSDYVENFCDELDGGFIEHFENAEKKGKNVILVAQECLDLLGIATKALNEQEYFVNDDGKPCDEYGNRLSSDLEHSVFEVIPGGKQ